MLNVNHRQLSPVTIGGAGQVPPKIDRLLSPSRSGLNPGWDRRRDTGSRRRLMILVTVLWITEIANALGYTSIAKLLFGFRTFWYTRQFESVTYEIFALGLSPRRGIAGEILFCAARRMCNELPYRTGREREGLPALSLFPSDGKSYIVSKPDRMEDPSNFWPNVPILARVLSPGSVVEWKSEGTQGSKRKKQEEGRWYRDCLVLFRMEVKGVSPGFIDYSSILKPLKLAQFLYLSKKELSLSR